MVQAPEGVFLYTGRRAVSAVPTESPLAPSVFAVPGRYLTERILTDSVTIVVWTPATVNLGRDIEAVRAQCPQVLARIPATPEPPIYYRVDRDVECLQSRLLNRGGRSVAFSAHGLNTSRFPETRRRVAAAHDESRLSH
jgi:hypothetical protein